MAKYAVYDHLGRNEIIEKLSAVEKRNKSLSECIQDMLKRFKYPYKERGITIPVGNIHFLLVGKLEKYDLTELLKEGE